MNQFLFYTKSAERERLDNNLDDRDVWRLTRRHAFPQKGRVGVVAHTGLVAFRADRKTQLYPGIERVTFLLCPQSSELDALLLDSAVKCSTNIMDVTPHRVVEVIMNGTQIQFKEVF
jgi:hypothetical protein